MKLSAEAQRWLLYALLFVSMAVPVIKPLGLPVEITKEVKAAYDYIDTIPAGSTVWIDFAFRVGRAPEMVPGCYAVVDHFFKRNIKVLFFYCIPEASPYITEVSTKLAAEHKKQYGVDYVDLGYKPDLDAALNGMARDFKSIFSVDSYGKPLSGFPITKDIKDVKDIAMFFVVHTGSPGIESYFRHIESQFKVPMVASMGAGSLADLYPRFTAGQLKGMIAGVVGAAEYEQLVGRPGLAAAGTDAQVMGHLVVVAAIVTSTITYFNSRRKKS